MNQLKMGQIKSTFHVFFSRLIGFLIFLVLLVLINILTLYITNETFRQIVFFLNTNLWLIVLFSIILLVGDLFGAIIFPFNLPAPLFNGIGGVLLIRFVFNIFLFVTSLLGISFNFDLDFIFFIIALIVFIIIIVTGYIEIFSRVLRPKKKVSKEESREKFKNR